MRVHPAPPRHGDRPTDQALHFGTRAVVATIAFGKPWGANGYGNANAALAQASLVIDTPNANSWTFWSRNSANTAWFLRTYTPNAILAPGC
jgi:hypothetical protein